MTKYAFPFEYEGKISPGMTDRDFIAAEVLKGLTANPNLIDTTNIVRSGDDMDPNVKRDELEHQSRLVAFARQMADQMVAELNTVPAGV